MKKLKKLVFNAYTRIHPEYENVFWASTAYLDCHSLAKNKDWIGDSRQVKIIVLTGPGAHKASVVVKEK